MTKRAGSNRIQDLEKADSLEAEDQFLFFQNSTQKTKKVSRSAMFASAGVSVELFPIISGLDPLLDYTLTGDPIFQQYSGFVDEKRQFLEQATGFLDLRRQLLDQTSGFLDQKRQLLEQASGFLDQRRQLLDQATGLLNDTGAQIRQDLVDLETSFTGASGVLRSSIDLNYIVATGASGTLAARIETLNSQFTGASGDLRSTITDNAFTFTTATGTLADRITTLNSQFTGASGALRATITDNASTFVNASGALAERISSLNTEFTGASGVLRATISGNEVAFVNASGALAQRISTLNAEFTGASGALRATINGTESSLVTASGALADRISVLNAEFTGASGALRATISGNETALVGASGALAQRISTLNTEFTGASGALRATISGNELAFVNASGALADRISTLNAEFTGASGALRSTISDNASVFSTATGTLADRITTLNSQFTGASGVLRGSITDNASTFAIATGVLADRITTVSAFANDVSGSVVQETSARVSAVSGVSGAVALNWGIKLNSDSGVIGAIKMVGNGETSAFLVMTDKFKVQTPSKVVPAGASTSDVTLLDMTTNGIVFGADVMSNNYSAGSAGWRIRRSSGDAEFNNVTVRGQIKGGTTLGDVGSTGYGLTVNNRYGIRSLNSNGVLTISAGDNNGVNYGAQIDMVGSFFDTSNAAGGNGNGQLILQAGYNVSNNFNTPTDGAIVLRTSHSSTTGTSDVGITRVLVSVDGTVLIGKGDDPVISGAPNSGTGKLIASNAITVGGNDMFENYTDGTIYVKKAADNGATTITLTGSSGDVTATQFTTSSSRKVKTNIKKLKSGIEVVNRLKPVSFNRKGTEQKDIGLIAEEVDEILPVVVKHNNKNEAEGLDYSKLTVILINAVKELSAEVKELKRKLKDANSN